MNHPLESARHTRPVPAEWPGLLGIAQNQLALYPDAPPLSLDNQAAVINALLPLNDEQLDANRYFALGLAMCGLAKALQQPHIRQPIVKAAGRNLAAYVLRPSSTPDNNLTGRYSLAMDKAFEPVVDAATDALTPEAQLLANSLVMAASIRRLDRKYPDASPEDIEAVEALKECQFVTRQPLATLISGNITGGTLSLLVAALHLKGKSPIAGPDSQDEASRASAAPPATESELRHLNLKNAAFRIASLRLDEAAEAFETYLAADASGQTFVRRDCITPQDELAPPDPAFDPIILHTPRLMCPAVHVEGLIPLMLDIVPDILLEAGKYQATNGIISYIA